MTRYTFCTVMLAAIAPCVLGLTGCSRNRSEADETPATMVYFDTASRETLTLPVGGDVPAAHPETGQRTLVPARYCPDCEHWHASPPLDVLQRDPRSRNCPKCGTPLKDGGPAAEPS
ncbi:hypothetical protein Mal4_26150 [Maioricimonas rarisocia]|uniref:Uncharacterized protein n=1 Tax=Maioricimonas rarisocia TaxID=2528026 RepID=A0A517Z721_9PLAN|nr:hypothetical protein [Maioricimonas rarisocia]QDU38288.1 hypothetical protein Mal4_26150 [Maioricimonas rarisocia]